MELYMCFKTIEEQNAWRNNCDIEKQLKKTRRDMRREIKLLLLGAGETGKSTFIKQMRIIHGSGFSDDEKKNQINQIFYNIFHSMRNMIHAMDLLNIKYDSDEHQVIMFLSLSTTRADLRDHTTSKERKNLVVIFSSHIYNDNIFNTFAEQLDVCKIPDCQHEFASYVDKLKKVWDDSGIQTCYDRRNEYQLGDSTQYFMNDLDRISGENYMPNEQDILRVRLPTTGIHEYHFDLKHTIFRMMDVGGQRSERRKWINCFENVNSIIFLISLSEYDQVLHEDSTKNRLYESKALFQTIMMYECFSTLPAVILFLNKTDLFEEKIEKRHLNDFIPEYKGPRGDADAGKEFIKKLYCDIMDEIKGKSLSERAKPTENVLKTSLFSHFTCATDTENIRVVFDAVQHTILRSNLKDFALIKT